MKFFTKTQQRTLPDHQTKETRKVLFYDQIFLLYIQHYTAANHTSIRLHEHIFFIESSRKHQCTHKRLNNAAVKTFIFSCNFTHFPLLSCRFHFLCNKVKRKLVRVTCIPQMCYCAELQYSACNMILILLDISSFFGL